jgi:hypothetical protein
VAVALQLHRGLDGVSHLSSAGERHFRYLPPHLVSRFVHQADLHTDTAPIRNEFCTRSSSASCGVTAQLDYKSNIQWQPDHENASKKCVTQYKPAVLPSGLGPLRNRAKLETEPRGARDGGDYFELTDRGRRYLEEYEQATGHPLQEQFGQ